MIITDEFILLNLPKTGSTFARTCLFEVHKKINRDIFFRLKNWGKKKQIIELKMPNIRDYNPNLKPDQHGTYTQIPSNYLTNNRDVVAIIRNPFEGYVSRYKFKWYERVDYTDDQRKIIMDKYPSFPNFSFDEYCSFENEFIKSNIEEKYHLKIQSEVGVLSAQFIQMFSKNPKHTFELINNSEVTKEDLLKDFPKIRFLKNENLNNDLHEYLLNKSYQNDKIDFILSENKVNVSSSSDDVSNLLEKKHKEFIMKKEWILFKLFPEYC